MRADLRHVRVGHGACARDRRAHPRPGTGGEDAGAAAARPADRHVAVLAEVDPQPARDLRRARAGDLGLASAVRQREAGLADPAGPAEAGHRSLR